MLKLFRSVGISPVVSALSAGIVLGSGHLHDYYTQSNWFNIESVNNTSLVKE